jgi:tRNA A37 threonylcarbamoyltransferase TsaD
LLLLSVPDAKAIIKIYARKQKVAILFISKRGDTMQPLKISLETAQKLAKALGMPIERIMHMPQHILVQKLLELEKKQNEQS